MKLSPETENEECEPDAELARRLGLALLLFAGLTFALGWLCLAAGGTVNPWLAPVSALLAIALSAGRRSPWAVAAATAAVIGGALVAAALFYDVSWDGQAYHQEAVLAFAEGWNPLRHGHLPAARFDNLWINHYPKAAWIIEAALLRTTGRLEAAKGLTALLGVGAACLSYAVLRPGPPRWLAALVALVLGAQPVLLAQAWSFYVDGMMAALMAALLALAVLGRRRPRDPLLLAGEAAALVVMINLKFTGLVYAALAVAALVAAARRPPLRRATGLLAVVAAGTLLLGFDPYVRNTLEEGHPFYPIAGSHPVDLLTPHQASSFLRQPRAVRLLVSVFARSSEGSQAPELKAPWSVRADELEAVSFADTRIGGFGPLFGAALLGALLLLPLLRRRLTPVVLLAGGAILLGTLVNPGLWWARYVPQFWLLPAGVLALAAVAPADRWLRAGRTALLLLLLGDQALVLGAQLGRQRALTRAIDDQLVVLRQASTEEPLGISFNSFDALAARLRRNRIDFQPSARPCPHPLMLVASPTEVCLPSRDVSALDAAGPVSSAGALAP
jgi:hypothetical protein